MSRSISESLSLLSETLGNCKTNLKEKSVENVDNIKISDVDEKILEIQSGGSSGFQYIQDVTVNSQPQDSNYTNSEMIFNNRSSSPEISFTVNTDNCQLLKYPSDLEIKEDGVNFSSIVLNNGKTYTVSSYSLHSNSFMIIGIHPMIGGSMDLFLYEVYS